MAKDLEVAIVFADVVGSTQLYDKFGDTKASETVALCLDVMKDATHQFDGTVIKTIGDEVMSSFPTADDAVNAAKEIQEEMEEWEPDQDRLFLVVSYLGVIWYHAMVVNGDFSCCYRFLAFHNHMVNVR